MSFLFTGDNKPLSAFCMTNVKEWDVFRNVDMDVEVLRIEVYRRYARCTEHLGKKHARGEEKLFSSPRDGRRFSRRSAKKPAGEDRDCESSAKSLGSPFYSPSSSFSLGIIARNRPATVEINRYRPISGGSGAKTVPIDGPTKFGHLLTLRYLRQLPIYSLKSFNLSFLIQFYNLISITESIARDAKLWKMTRIKKKMGCNDIPPNITLAQFLRLSKDGAL
ncbi:hypothetical protein B296_00001094 [Ensete ventricosum]|uniref:Uncharacterized protein n=1 Tax=Ensete ventricosum TaxID=4639 RepID=A0A427BBK1_ENSVE|nr:hypothetical protein B296_00001094 [Ensete ventricosum]